MKRIRYLVALLMGSTAQFEFYHRHRGILEAGTAGSTNYAARPNSSWTQTLQMNVSVSAPTTCTVAWDDEAKTQQTYPLTVGGQPVTFQYTHANDTMPVNPGDALALRTPREKRVTVTFQDNNLVTGISFNKAEITRFGEEGLTQTSILFFEASGQLLSNLPPMPDTVQTIGCGLDMIQASIANPQSGNRIPWSAVAAATELCRNSLKTLIVGSSVVTGSISTIAQDVPFTQFYDLSLFPNLESAYLQSAGVQRIKTTAANVALKRIWQLGPLSPNRPAITVTDLYIPPTLLELKLGGTNASRAENTAEPIALQTARDLTTLYLSYVYADDGHGFTALQRQTGFYTTVNNLYLSPANVSQAGTRTADFTGCGSASASHPNFPAGVTAQLDALYANGWSLTYTP
ncbi:hypothetical protein [Hymenobacter sp. B81]|uniref:hypothetical protein n=1 Tax=Hymenobacter sp. B81 TaxID=3344878 RepID=UPI0037DCCD53